MKILKKVAAKFLLLLTRNKSNITPSGNKKIVDNNSVKLIDNNGIQLTE